MMRKPSVPLFLAALSIASGCIPLDDASRSEMREAVVEIAELGAGDGTQAEIVELTTSFTLGQGVQAAAEELRDFVASQVPCSEVTLAPGQLTIDFGDLSDACTYRGRTYAGVVSVQLEAQGDGYRVTHTYDGLTGGTVTLDGTATVDWDGNVRNVVTDLELRSDRGTWQVQADRTQTFTACPDAQAVCVDIDGERTWSGPRGDWEMTIDGVHARSIDPVPEAGTYSVLTPKGKTVELSFERIDADTIEVSVTGGRSDLVFHVTAAGQVSDG
jgi:hypothetical protein